MGEKEKEGKRGLEVGGIKEKEERGTAVFTSSFPKVPVLFSSNPTGTPPGMKDPRKQALSLLVPTLAGLAGKRRFLS